MKNMIYNFTVTLLIIMNIFVGVLIYQGFQPKCFVDGCNCARIKSTHYCAKHASYGNSHDICDIAVLKGNKVCLKARNRN